VIFEEDVKISEDNLRRGYSFGQRRGLSVPVSVSKGNDSSSEKRYLVGVSVVAAFLHLFLEADLKLAEEILQAVASPKSK
jgi:hypothetical protein